MRPLVLLLVLLVAMPVDAQPPCTGPPGRSPLPVGSAPVVPPAGSQPLPDTLCAQLADIAARLARIEAQQKLEADKKPVVVAVLGNRYVELALVAAATFIAGLKVR